MTLRDKPTAWQAYGNCAGVSFDLMFPGRGDDTAAAKAICVGCQVREECLEFALTEPPERHGIWGGLSERERRRIRVQRWRERRAQHGTRSCYVAGCRCADCTDANNAYSRARNTRRRRRTA